MKTDKRLIIFMIIVAIYFLSCNTNKSHESGEEHNTYRAPETAPLAVLYEADAQVIVQRIDNNREGHIAIYIDGEYAGKLSGGEIGYYKLTTRGIHKITASWDYYSEHIVSGVMVNWSSGKPTDPIEFVDFGSFYVKYVGYETRKDYSGTDYLVELTPNNGALIGSSVGISSSQQAINEAYITLSKNIPNTSRIAIVNVNSNNINESIYFIDELTKLFVNNKYFVVDRNRLQIILDEQQFQLSGHVSDDTIVSIGNIAGANVVLTGDINNIYGKRRFVIRALDVLTSQILSMSTVDF